MNLKDRLSKRGKLPKGAGTEWLPLCTLDVTTGALWAGDPHLANADDGHVTRVPAGRYVVEGIARAQGRDRVVSRLRVRLASEKNPTVGKELGDTGTDSAMIGVCDIKAFDKACGRDPGDEVQDAIEAQTGAGCGVIRLRKFPGAIMPFVPTGSDGGGPVLALMSGRKRVGIELSFVDDASDRNGGGDPTAADQKKPLDEAARRKRTAALTANDRDGYIKRVMADGTEAAFWLGGELKANQQFSLWSSAEGAPIHYRIRPKGKAVPKQWTAMKQPKKQKLGNHPASAFETLGPGKYEIDFRVGQEIYSALKLALA
jgi:hypothetical protein